MGGANTKNADLLSPSNVTGSFGLYYEARLSKSYRLARQRSGDMFLGVKFDVDSIF